MMKTRYGLFLLLPSLLSAQEIHTTAVWVTFGIYLILLMIIGILGEIRFSRGYEDFVAAGKRLGAWVTAISAAASAESAWLILGLSGLGYKLGFAAYWIALGGIFGYWFNARFIILPLKAESTHLGSLTLSDYIEAKLRDPGHLLRVLSALIITVFMTAYVVAQFTGAGKQMEGMGLTSYSAGVWIGAVVIALYVLMGGYAAVSYTDLLQGLLMATVLVIFPLWGMILAGGPLNVWKTATSLELTHLWGPHAFALGALGGILAEALGIAFGYPGMPHVIIRYFTVRDARTARKAAWIAIVWSVLAYFGAVTLGILSRVLVELGKMPQPADPEKALAVFTTTFLHPILAGVMLAAVTAAIMSTADSQLIYASTTLVNDLYRAFTGKTLSSHRLVWTTRGVIALLSAVALGLALRDVRLIYRFVLYAWSALGAAFSPIVILSLYDRHFNRWGALASLIAGPAVTILWRDGLGRPGGLYELFVAFPVSFVLAWLVSRVWHDSTTR